MFNWRWLGWGQGGGGVALPTPTSSVRHRRTLDGRLLEILSQSASGIAFSLVHPVYFVVASTRLYLPSLPSRGPLPTDIAVDTPLVEVVPLLCRRSAPLLANLRVQIVAPHVRWSHEVIATEGGPEDGMVLLAQH
jgi:hypothetical protein